MHKAVNNGRIVCCYVLWPLEREFKQSKNNLVFCLSVKG